MFHGSRKRGRINRQTHREGSLRVPADMIRGLHGDDERGQHVELGESSMHAYVPGYCHHTEKIKMQDLLSKNIYKKRDSPKIHRKLSMPECSRGNVAQKHFHRQLSADKAELKPMIDMGTDQTGAAVTMNPTKYEEPKHSLFVQLNELVRNKDGFRQWSETARWIKYEEDIDPGTQQWSRPHVAPLSFQSLHNARRCIDSGVVMLGLKTKSLTSMVNKVVDQMSYRNLISDSDKNIAMRSLLLSHSHPDCDCLLPISQHDHCVSMELGGSKPDVYLVEGDNNIETHKCYNREISHHIPEGTQASICLVGVVEEMENPAIAFVRLRKSVAMKELTEATIPVLFAFILLGPSKPKMNPNMDYHEVGRSIATLLSNPTFCRVAYNATDHRQLLRAIDEFMNDSIVLPPDNRDSALSRAAIRVKADKILNCVNENQNGENQNQQVAQNYDKKKQMQRQDAVNCDLNEIRIDTSMRARNSRGSRRESQSNIPESDDFDADDVLPPLVRTHIPFGGLIRDIKRRYKWYGSDFTDALNWQCVAAILFIYMVTVSISITMGGVMFENTDGQMGVTETLLFGSIGGIIYSLLSGQPLMIVGSTGPLLLLEHGIALICKHWECDLLTVRMYCSMWIFVISVIVAFVEGSSCIRYITRFTEDIFSFLITLLFISKPVISTVNIYRVHPVAYGHTTIFTPGANREYMVNNTFIYNEGYAGLYDNQNHVEAQPNTALFSTILTAGTFIIALLLYKVRNGKILSNCARRSIGDFGIPVSIIVMVLLANTTSVFVNTLQVPRGLSPSTVRFWFIPMNKGKDVPTSVVFASFVLGLMAYIVMFLETHIAELIVDKPMRKLKKGNGYHLDIVIVAFINVICGLCGAPWVSVATIRSITHVNAVTVMSRFPPGSKPQIKYIIEQRLTGLMVSILTGLSVLASEWLRYIPISVLFGVFLYMGVQALRGNQFWTRFKILFQIEDNKHFSVSKTKMHLYTLIQIIIIALLIVVQYSKISFSLPVFIIICIPLRMLFSYLFTERELNALDSADTDSLTEIADPDFYEESGLPG